MGQVVVVSEASPCHGRLLHAACFIVIFLPARFSRVLRPILAILYHTELRSLIQTVIKSLPQVCGTTRAEQRAMSRAMLYSFLLFVIDSAVPCVIHLAHFPLNTHAAS